MMNEDTILKYLSDLMEESEKIQFENKLKDDSILQENVNRIKSTLETLAAGSNPKVDTSYFVNLVPNIRQKIESRESKFSLRFIPAISFIAAVIIGIFLQIPQMNDNSDANFYISENDLPSILTDADEDLFDEFLEISLVKQYDFYNDESSNNFLNTYLDDAILLEIGYEDVNGIGDYSYTETFNDYSNEEVNIIFEELINKKIL